MNGGNGWYGVSYFHSMEVLRLCGNMNVQDYGGSYYDDGKRWIDGYEVYYNAMFNRISYSLTSVREVPHTHRQIPVTLYPNPFRENVTFHIDFQEPIAAFSLVIHDLDGRKVRIICNGESFPKGTALFRWDGRNDSGTEVSNGMYFYRVIAGKQTAQGKIIHLKN